MWETVSSFYVFHHTGEILENEASLGEGPIKELGVGACVTQGEAEQGWKRENDKGDNITNWTEKLFHQAFQGAKCVFNALVTLCCHMPSQGKSNCIRS